MFYDVVSYNVFGRYAEIASVRIRPIVIEEIVPCERGFFKQERFGSSEIKTAQLFFSIQVSEDLLPCVLYPLFITAQRSKLVF